MEEIKFWVKDNHMLIKDEKGKFGILIFADQLEQHGIELSPFEELLMKDREIGDNYIPLVYISNMTIYEHNSITHPEALWELMTAGYNTYILKFFPHFKLFQLEFED